MFHCYIYLTINKSSMSMSMSIVILTTSLRRQFVMYMPTTVSNPLLFLLKKKMRIFCNHTVISSFSNKVKQ